MNLMMRRRALMNVSKTNILPIGYKSIIGTGKPKQLVISSFPFTVMIDTTIVSLVKGSTYSCIFGANYNLQLAYNSSGIPTVGNATASKQFVHENHRYVFEGKFTDVGADSYYKINGEDTGLHRKTNNTVSDFFLVSAASSFALADALIHNLKIFDNDGVLIHDYLPCVRTSDSTEGLYDIVNNQFI